MRKLKASWQGFQKCHPNSAPLYSTDRNILMEIACVAYPTLQNISLPMQERVKAAERLLKWYFGASLIRVLRANIEPQVERKRVVWEFYPPYLQSKIKSTKQRHIDFTTYCQHFASDHDGYVMEGFDDDVKDALCEKYPPIHNSRLNDGLWS